MPLLIYTCVQYICTGIMYNIIHNCVFIMLYSKYIGTTLAINRKPGKYVQGYIIYSIRYTIFYACRCFISVVTVEKRLDVRTNIQSLTPI